MSKISEYQESVRKWNAERDKETVGDFALALGQGAGDLLARLKEAGVTKLSASDSLTRADKDKYLDFLKLSTQGSGRRTTKKITLKTKEQRLFDSAAKMDNGAELVALRYFASQVLFGHPIDAKFQQLANLIIAKAVLLGALPNGTVGRPKWSELDSIGLEAARRYWDLFDSGVGYQKAVTTVSGEYHKSERHIMRLIAKHKSKIGASLEQRIRRRERDEWYRQQPFNEDLFAQLTANCPREPDLDLDDCLNHLDELTRNLVGG